MGSWVSQNTRWLNRNNPCLKDLKQPTFRWSSGSCTSRNSPSSHAPQCWALSSGPSTLNGKATRNHRSYQRNQLQKSFTLYDPFSPSRCWSRWVSLNFRDMFLDLYESKSLSLSFIGCSQIKYNEAYSCSFRRNSWKGSGSTTRFHAWSTKSKFLIWWCDWINAKNR